MAASVVQTLVLNDSTAENPSESFTVPATTPGNALVVLVACNTKTRSVTGVTDSAGNVGWESIDGDGASGGSIVGSGADIAGGQVAATLAYDDATLVVSAVEWVNATAFDVLVTVTPEHGRTRTFKLPAGGSGTVDVSKFGLSLVQEADGSLTFGWADTLRWGA